MYATYETLISQRAAVYTTSVANTASPCPTASTATEMLVPRFAYTVTEYATTATVAPARRFTRAPPGAHSPRAP